MKNKVTTSFLLFLFLFSICNAQIETGEQNGKIVEINYKEQINGYSVNIYFMPKHIRYDLIIGPAIIEFINEQKPYKSFTITNNFFGFSSEKISTNLDEHRSVETLNTHKITSDYKGFELHENNTIGDTNKIPFFFFDIDFDGEKELLICQTQQGQRGLNSYKVYGGYDYGREVYADISIDSRTIIDPLNKKLETHYANSASSYGIETYANFDDVLQLIKIEDWNYDIDTGKQYHRIYSVENGVKKLVTKVEIKN